MITLTVGEVLKDKNTGRVKENGIYIIRENKTIFYIGKSLYDIVDRVKQHFGMGVAFGREVKKFAQVILNNNPMSRRWKVDFLTLGECAKKLKMNIPIDKIDCNIAVNIFEQAMIKKYRPCFNGTYNHNPSQLPKKYQKQQHDDAIGRRKIFNLGFGEQL